MRAKVKTTVIDTGQEYLLLVSKMNLKGILVNTSQMLKPNTQLMLELKLNENEPILIKGYVHKISEESSSKKGMVIAFLNPSDAIKKKIQKFIDESKDASGEVSAPISEPISPSPPVEEKKKSKWNLGKKKKEPEKPAPPPPREKPAEKPLQPSKTTIVGDEDLPSLSLSSPDNKGALSIATMDEESLHANNPGMSGSTRHVKIDQRGSIKKTSSESKKVFRLSTIYKAFIFVLFIIIAVLCANPMLKIMDKKFGKKISLSGSTNSTTSTNATPKNAPSSETPVEAASGILDLIEVDDQGTFIKITALGKGNFSNNQISKLTGPNRIHIELPEIVTSKVAVMTAVNNNPIAKINTTKGKSISIDIIYMAGNAPNFEAKVFNGGLDIFIYR